MTPITEKQTNFMQTLLGKLQFSKEKESIKEWISNTKDITKEEASTAISYLLYLRSSEISKLRINNEGIWK